LPYQSIAQVIARAISTRFATSRLEPKKAVPDGTVSGSGQLDCNVLNSLANQDIEVGVVKSCVDGARPPMRMFA
jgi:hypothetical protein